MINLIPTVHFIQQNPLVYTFDVRTLESTQLI